MARGGGKEKVLMQDTVSKEEYDRIQLQVYEKEMSLCRANMIKAVNHMNIALGRVEKEDKIRNNETLQEISLKVCGLADIVSGSLKAQQAVNDQATECLNELFYDADREIPGKRNHAPERNCLLAAISAKFWIRFYKNIAGIN